MLVVPVPATGAFADETAPKITLAESKAKLVPVIAAIMFIMASTSLPAALSPKARSFVGSVDKDPSGFFFSVSYLEQDGRALGIVYAVNAAQIREAEATIIDIDKKEAMAMTRSLSASGMFDKTNLVPPGVTPRGWNVFLGTRNAEGLYEAFWHLGEKRDALFKSPNIMKVREVLSPKSREAWDDFVRRVRERNADLPENIQSPKAQGDENAVPAAATEATELLLRSTEPSPEVDAALAIISEYEDKSMRLVETIKAADGSLHVEMEQRYPKLGILVYHYDQKFTHASKIPATKCHSP